MQCNAVCLCLSVLSVCVRERVIALECDLWVRRGGSFIVHRRFLGIGWNRSVVGGFQIRDCRVSEKNLGVGLVRGIISQPMGIRWIDSGAGCLHFVGSCGALCDAFLRLS